MNLPLTQEQEAWLARQKIAVVTTQKAEKGGPRCGTCKHMRGHPWSPKYKYCALGRDTRTTTGLATTRPNKTCRLWEADTKEQTP